MTPATFRQQDGPALAFGSLGTELATGVGQNLGWVVLQLVTDALELASGLLLSHN